MAKKISEDYIKFTLSLNSTQAQQEIHKLSKESEELKKENKSLQNEMKRLTAAGKRNSTEFKNLRGQLRLNNQTIDENNAKIRQLNSTLKLGERTMADLRKEAGQLKHALDHTSKALEPEAYEKYTKRLKEVREEMSKLSGKGEGTAGIFKKIGWLKLGTIGSISQFGYNFTNFLTDSIGKMKDWVTESTEMAASADGVLRAFKQLDNPGLLRNLRTATKGTVTDLDLMKAAVKARDFRIPLEDLGKYLAFAQMKAQQTGQSVDYMVDSIVTGLGRQSVMILDNLGLSSAEINDEIAKTGDFMKGVATIVEKNLASAGETYISAADRAAQATTELANRQLEMGRKLLPIKETVASVYEQVQIWLVNAATWMMDHAKAVMTVIALLGSYLAVSKAIAAAEAIRLSVMTNIRGVTLLFAAAQAKLTGHTARAAAAMRLFNTTCKANVIGAIVAVVTAATVAFIAFRKETDKVAEINNRAEKSVAGERAELEALKRIIHDSSQSYESRKTAIEQMQKLVPNYHASLTTEGKLIEKNAAAIDLYVQKQLLAAKQQEAKAKYQEAIGARTDWVSGQDKKMAMQMKEVEWSLKDFHNQGKSEEEVIAGAGVSVTAFRAWREQKQQLDNEVKQYGEMLANYARQMAELESKFVNKREPVIPITPTISASPVKNPSKSTSNPEQPEADLQAWIDSYRRGWQDYFIEFGDYQEKRKAITEKYNDELLKIELGSPKYAITQKKMQQELEKLDTDLMAQSGLWGNFFSDMANRSDSAIQDIVMDIEALIDYMNGVEGAEIPDIFKSSETTLKAINDAMSNPEALNKFTKNLGKKVKEFKKMLEKDNPFELISKGFSNNDTESLEKGFQGVAAAAGELSNVLQVLGADADSTAGKVTSVIGSTASMAAQGASIGGPWGAVIGGAIGMASGLIGVLGADYSEYNKMVEEYGNLTDVWDILIDKKREYIDINYGDEARKAGNESLELLGKKRDSNRTLGLNLLNSGSSAGSHSIGVRQRKRMSSQGWAELRDAAREIGFNYDSVASGRMTGLFDLSVEQLRELQEQAPTFWAGLQEDVRGYLQNIIDCEEEIEEMRKQMQETLTGVSFDSFYDNFVSMLSDMDKDGKYFTDNFGKYLQNAIMRNLLANKYRKDIEKLYEDWTKASDSDGDEIFDLDEKEADDLKEQEQQLADRILAERNALAEVYGWNTTAGQQTASAKGFQAMSQDTGEELNGRFTALQESGMRQETHLLDISTSVRLMMATGTAQLECSTEIRDILHECNDHLSKVVKNTASLHRIAELAEESEKHLERL